MAKIGLLELHRLYPFLKNRLGHKRFRHSMLVAARAAELARLHGLDWYRAAMAGLLHDICQCDSNHRQLKYLRAHGILLDEFTMSQPQIWHARTGALLLYELGVRDRELLRCVRYHTTGRANMSAMEMVVYLADATSAEREYPGVSELRAMADKDLAVAMRINLWYTVNTLVESGNPIVRDAWAAYNYFTFSVPRSIAAATGAIGSELDSDMKKENSYER